MRVLFTGASSLIGNRVLREMLASEKYSEIWGTVHRSELNISDPKLRAIEADLLSDADWQTIPEIDLVVHFAAVTHSQGPEWYWKVNHQGTRRLATVAQARGCRRFAYLSTRCATRNAGAYGESKLAAEDELKKFDWASLLIIRPSEVYGVGGKEGLDRLIGLAQRQRLAPILFGNPKIEFAPLHIDDFVGLTSGAIMHQEIGSVVLELSGPEDLSGPALGWRLARRLGALPVPVWWSLAGPLLTAANLVAPDQIQRLTCAKTSSAKSADLMGKIGFMTN